MSDQQGQKPLTFLWLAPEDGKSRPKGAGVNLLASYYGSSYRLESRVLPDMSIASGCSVEQGIQLLRGGMRLVEAEYLIVEGARISIIMALLEDPSYIDRVLVVRRNKAGQVLRFEIVTTEYKTKRFPPE